MPALHGFLNHQQRRYRVGAREKLNRHHALGALGVAAIVGCFAGSWLVFGAVAAALIAGSIHAGEIRPDKGKRQSPGRN
jgi:hypothetical protein